MTDATHSGGSSSGLTTASGDIVVNYLTQGDPTDPPVLMIMGLGAQRVSWPPEFVEALVERGRYVITFDNRDAGESTHLSDAEVDLGPVGQAYGIAARLTVHLPGMDRTHAQALVDAAHQVCPYSNATRGNIDVTITLA